jgi:hypothetical protein
MCAQSPVLLLPLLLLCVVACSTQSSNFVMTAAAQNLLCLQLAASIGVGLDDPFKTWLLGGCVPACLGACGGGTGSQPGSAASSGSWAVRALSGA